MTKHILSERSESQVDRSDRNVLICYGRIHTIKFNGIHCHPVAIFGITSNQNLMGTSIFAISTSNLEHNLVRYMALTFCNLG